MSEVMKQVDPQKYTAYMNDIKGGGNGLGQLLNFAQKVPQHPDWINKYKERTGQSEELLNKPQLNNRFDKADTSSASAFMNSMQNLIKQSSVTEDSYTQNMRGFFRNLGVQVDLKFKTIAEMRNSRIFHSSFCCSVYILLGTKYNSFKTYS